MAATTVHFSDDGREVLAITFKLSKTDRKILNSLLPKYPREYSRMLAGFIEVAVRTEQNWS